MSQVLKSDPDCSISTSARGQSWGVRFTLIELLVVIAIIAVLASLLLPALSKARSAAHKSSSLSNVKQLSLSIFNYADDSDGSLPFFNFSDRDLADGTGTDPRHVTWARELLSWQYVPSKDLYWSPARTPKKNALNWAMHPGYGLNVAAGPSYVDAVDNGIYPVKLGAGPPAEEMIMLAEVWSGQWDVGDPDYDGLYFSSADRYVKDDGPQGDGSAVNHKLFCYGNRNVQSYVDGHGVAIQSLEVGYESALGGTSGYWSVYPNINAFYYKAPWYTSWWAAP